MLLDLPIIIAALYLYVYIWYLIDGYFLLGYLQNKYSYFDSHQNENA